MREKQLKRLGSNVKRCRELRGWTQEELALSSGVSQSVIGSIEAPNVLTNQKIGILLDLADALEMLPCALMDLTSEDVDNTYEEKIKVRTDIPREERREKQIFVLGLNLQYYRKLRKYGKATLKDLSGVCTTTISGIEAPKRYNNNTMGTILDLANALDIPLHYLFDFTKGDLLL